MNLLKETIGKIKEYKKRECDVLWVGSVDGEYAMGWSKFKAMSNFEYDSGFGGQEIATDLVVVGKKWWLERHEYDGSEWWEFKVLPVTKQNTKSFNRVGTSQGWVNLSEMNIVKE